MTKTLTFECGAEEYLLKVFGNEIDDEGYIMNTERDERETTPDGNEIHIEDFGGVEKGSTLYLEDDIVSVGQHVERRQD